MSIGYFSKAEPGNENRRIEMINSNADDHIQRFLSPFYFLRKLSRHNDYVLYDYVRYVVLDVYYRYY